MTTILAFTVAGKGVNGRPLVIIASLVFLMLSLLVSTAWAQSDDISLISDTVNPTDTEEELSLEAVIVEPEPTIELVVEKIPGRADAGDFVVGPGRTVLELQPGQTIIVNLLVTNRISEDRQFNLQVEDISGSRDPQQGITIMGNERGPYSIRDYISFPVSEFTLSLGERARVPVEISIPADAEPGGYYGAVFVTTTRIDFDPTAVNSAQSPIIARIGSQFFVTVPGEVMTNSVLRDVSLATSRWWYESGPVSVMVTTENTGSIHLVQGADMTVKNMFGEEVGYVQVEPWFVLPQALRLREIIWDREFLLGRYTADVRVGLGYDDIVETRTIVFWVLPWRIIGGVFVTFFVIIFSLRVFFRRFEFKRKSG